EAQSSASAVDGGKHRLAGSEDGQPGPAPEVDPWAAFAPRVVGGPGRLGQVVDRLVNAVERCARHEWTLATLGSALLAATMTWPVLRHPMTTLPDDLSRSAPDAWRLAWAGHSLITDPTGFFSGNVIHQESGIIPPAARLLGYAPAGLIGTGTPAALLRYNILFVLAFALAALGGYALIRQLGGRRLGALVGSVAFAFAPWRLGQAAHLDALSVGGLALALAMLARGHGWSLRHGRRPERRNAGWVLAGWLLAAWQISLSVTIGLPFAYLLAAVVLIMLGNWLAHRGRPRPRVLVLLADLAGLAMAAASAVGVTVLALHASDVSQAAGTKSDADLAAASIPLRGFITAPAESLLWGGLHDEARDSLPDASQMAMLPGFFLLALAVAGLIVSAWRWQHRLLMLIGVVASAALAMGTFGPEHGWLGYLTLAREVPGFEAVQSPSRLIIWPMLLLCLLAAGAVDWMIWHGSLVFERLSRIERVMRLRVKISIDATTGRTTSRVRGRRRRAVSRIVLRLALVLPLALVTVEALPRFETPAVSPAPAVLHEITTPVLLLPTGAEEDAMTMLWSVQDYPLIANAAHDAAPAALEQARAVAKSFPSAESIEAFGELGVTTVVVLRVPAAKAGYAVGIDAIDEYLVQSLNLVVHDRGDALIFTLPPRS
ncbi:MAG: hypothetical protein JXA67_04030, partial [Micromonosporaceae bacterium]|nr:hypothetical protein [Micromonosporaceae bacterium]